MAFDFTPYIVYWSIGAVFICAEWLRPARPVNYRSVLVGDLFALGAYNLFFLAAVFMTERVPIPNYVPGGIQALPFAAKLLLFMLLVDCSAYWLHRMWHTGLFWRIHKWHHAPTYMYWLAGVRASLPQVIMAGIPFTIWLPLLTPIPPLFFVLYPVFLIVTNNWMHMNVTWRSKWLENVFVTPRYHHIHHGDQPHLYMQNFGVIFTFWDRLFGTYADPEVVDDKFQFGLREKGNPIRLAIGL